jgi:hypothetical protein
MIKRTRRGGQLEARVLNPKRSITSFLSRSLSPTHFPVTIYLTLSIKPINQTRHSTNQGHHLPYLFKVFIPKLQNQNQISKHNKRKKKKKKQKGRKEKEEDNTQPQNMMKKNKKV